ncbi:putative anti-sigma-YlaC factor YlaD [Arthrobacter ginsengisoli]|uniref:Anti-sigma-YlaC factor YlaD n=1 Tax=Arthrobacter ginsengisoli TaxID=1356565 RepID=A0ABU1UE56_9MICC|nr:zf-HC2 domain-containing protein [Arthrobacter ginsengisoli]MDR7083484.1 putative anti-sigma-YlaC factor YlaD [Arthrobacter ginsengisoli]
MSATELHQLLGAYLLGGLEPDEAAAFEQHLGSCADCRRELDELASLPALLDALPVPDAVALGAVAVRDPAPPVPAPAAVPQRMLDELSARRRKARRRWTAALAAAAAACLTLGILAAPLANQPPKPDASYSVQAGDGLQITVGMVKKTWGTELAVEGRSLPVDGTLSLWVKDTGGGEDRACAWSATPSGRVRITGATPLQLTNISSVEMRDGQQQTVAVIAVPRG